MYITICSIKNLKPNFVMFATIIEKKTLLTAIVIVKFMKTFEDGSINKERITKKIDTKIKDREIRGRKLLVLV